ncbi:MAG: hypothetical protein CMJ18_18175, partial [Phycisphaeraceae bacterium]|nr:hypothetical protein [Phycisphaeraceae bacterium]
TGEYRELTDPQTNARIHQLTDHASINHSLFFLNPSFRPGTRAPDHQVAFVTHRAGQPQLCLFDFADATARCITEADGLQAFSPVFSRDGGTLYYTTSAGEVRRVGVDSGRAEVIARADGASLGECGLSHDGAFIVTAAKREKSHQLLVIDLGAGSCECILDTELQILHPQFHPRDSSRIEYAGHPIPRLWFIRRDGSENHCPYENAWNEFIVHESFLGDSDDMIFAVWPNRLARFTPGADAPTTIAEINAWHMASSRDGRRIVSDTNHPDRGMILIDPQDGSHTTLCYPGASNCGSQWEFDHPATPDAWTRKPSPDADPRVLSWMEMKVDTVYGPQWTHPHPAFDDEAKRVVYTSDASGDPQVFVVEVEA